MRSDLTKLEQQLKFKDEEYLEMKLNSNAHDHSSSGLQKELREKEAEIHEKKAVIKDLEKRNEILEHEIGKLKKLFQEKIHEIEEVKARTFGTHEVEELRNSVENLKKMNMVKMDIDWDL